MNVLGQNIPSTELFGLLAHCPTRFDGRQHFVSEERQLGIPVQQDFMVFDCHCKFYWHLVDKY